jgi:fimbrial chaperone protein
VFTAVVLAGPLASGASAASFNVSPTQVYLNGRTSSALLTLRNDSTEPLRFQLSVFAWDQSPTGEMTLTPTTDIVFFPALVTLAPNEQRKVRVGRVVEAGAVERTYRIFVEELPPLESVTQGNAGVKVLTKMGIPIFVRPSKEATAVAITGIGAQNGTLTFTLANSGTVHVVPERVTVRGFARGEPVFEGQLQAWYMLAGGRREFDFPLPAECSRATAFQVEVSVGDSTIDQRVDAPAGACMR